MAAVAATDRREPPPARGAAPSKGGGARPKEYRPEIQGLRAVAVLLVVAYHIWVGRVSGGVDVFLLLTGFLITGSLVRMVERDGRVRFWRFWCGLAKRLLPPAAVVLLGVLAGAFLWLPQARWRDTIDEVVAAALYYVNWRLAFDSVDYLARGDFSSPVQHFWSLAIQGQTYLLWPLLVTAALLFAAAARRSLRRTAFAVFLLVFAVSLTYSVVMTAANQPWAYFDTGTRLWEFALGAMLALALPRLRVPRGPRIAMGWLGLAALVLCGALIPVSTLFPGYVALWPTGAAVLVILAGTTGGRFAADRLLTWRTLTRVGDLAYSLYLWHWPVLICYLEATGSTRAGLFGGLLVLGLSLVLAVATKRLLEDGVGWLTRRWRAPGWSLALAAAFLAPVLVTAHLWTAHLDEQQRLREERAADLGVYPGAQVLAEPELIDLIPDAPVYPDPADADSDLPVIYEDDCAAGLSANEAIVCHYGDASSEHTLAMVGASRTAHWFPALLEIAESNGWHLVVLIKSGCQFSTDPPTRDGEVFPECLQWRAEAMAELADIRPDVVFTSSTRATPGGETIPGGFVERWAELEELGIDVAGVRDAPRRSTRGDECVGTRGAEHCAEDAGYSLAEQDPASQLTGVPDNVALIDMTGYLCLDGECPAVLGNVLVYRDQSHMTAAFARTLAPMLEEELLAATGW